MAQSIINDYIKMNTSEVLQFCLNKGLLIDKEVLNLFGNSLDDNSIKLFIERLKNYTKGSVINKEVLNNNKKIIERFISDLPIEKSNLENLKKDLDMVSEENENDNSSSEIEATKSIQINKKQHNYKTKIEYMPSTKGKKFEVKNFVNLFRDRINKIRTILQEHSELENLVSIGKLSNKKQNVSIIGIISDKRVTKNGNFIFEVEDLSGRINVLINKDKENIFKKAQEIPLDSIIGFKCSGNREFLFANDVIFPESMIPSKKNSPVEEYALFIGDLHYGSNLFLQKGFDKFINYLNGELTNDEEYKKIKYLFIVGDLVTGIGNYPGQEKDLMPNMKNLEDQFLKLSELLGKIRKDISIIISPGNHDGVRIMEPQPLFDEKYAWPLYNMENVIITTNPAIINIGNTKSNEEIEGFSGFNVLTYHGFSFPYYAKNIPYLIQLDSINKPEEIMKYLLKYRHLAPTHGSTQYFPLEEDPLIIKNVPDIFVSAHTHKSGITYYNNVLVVSVSTWEAMSSYQEKLGNKPDHCKVPMFNLKTGEVKILDFE